MENKIFLIGDTIEDITTNGKVIGLSAETPTITIQDQETITTSGGAAFVSRNLKALGKDHIFLSNHTIEKQPVIKHRFWAGGYKLFQVNKESSEPLSKSEEDKLLSELNPVDGDKIIFSDYRHGLITKRLVNEIFSMIWGMNVITFVDTQVSKQKSNHDWYKSAHYIFVNDNEEQYIQNNFFGYRIVKHGENGSTIRYPFGNKHSIAGILVKTIDTCGAGDAFLAAFIAFHHLGDKVALEKANKWAALKCCISGMGVPSLADL